MIPIREYRRREQVPIPIVEISEGSPKEVIEARGQMENRAFAEELDGLKIAERKKPAEVREMEREFIIGGENAYTLAQLARSGAFYTADVDNLIGEFVGLSERWRELAVLDRKYKAATLHSHPDYEKFKAYAIPAAQLLGKLIYSKFWERN